MKRITTRQKIKYLYWLYNAVYTEHLMGQCSEYQDWFTQHFEYLDKPWATKAEAATAMKSFVNEIYEERGYEEGKALIIRCWGDDEDLDAYFGINVFNNEKA